jgi:hypothetical protein
MSYPPGPQDGLSDHGMCAFGRGKTATALLRLRGRSHRGVSYSRGSVSDIPRPCGIASQVRKLNAPCHVAARSPLLLYNVFGVYFVNSVPIFLRNRAPRLLS